MTRLPVDMKDSSCLDCTSDHVQSERQIQLVFVFAGPSFMH